MHGLSSCRGPRPRCPILRTFREAGFDIDIAAHLRSGGAVLGLCGGYQMLGRVLRDPDGIEGPPGEAEGLGLLDLETTLSDEKRLERARGVTFDGVPFEGYEMHLGRTEGPDCDHPFAVFENGTREGAVSPKRASLRHLCARALCGRSAARRMACPICRRTYANPLR